MARSMNSINNIEVNEVEFPDGSTITSAKNLVQLDTNNNFISNNTFNVNLPTSNVNPNVVDIGNNTMLNKYSADKLYIGNDEISECFDGASITGRDITLTRVDGENDKVIAIPETSLSTCVLLTGIQTIGDVKTFSSFPVKSGTTETELTPTADGQLTTKKYVDVKTTEIATNSTNIATNTTDIATNSTNIATNTTNIATNSTNIATNSTNIATNTTDIATNSTAIGNAVLKTGIQTIDGVKTFTSFPVKSGTTTPTENGQLATKKYVDDTAGAVPIGDALLSGGTEASPQTFTEFNKFDKLTIFELTRPKHIVPQGSPAQTPVDADFITKQDGDVLYGSSSGSARLAGGDVGDPQIFTGENKFEESVEMEGNSTFSGANAFTSTNTFNTNRPTTTLTTAITSGMFITKDDAENRLNNILISGNLEGNVSTENGNASSTLTPFRRSVSGNTIVTAQNGTKFIKIGTIPASIGASKDFTKVVLTGGVWTAPPVIITAWFNNRDGFKYMYKKEGNIQVFISLFAIRPGGVGGTIEIWFFVAGGSGQFTRATWNIDTVEGEVFKNPASQSSPTTGTLMFDSNSGAFPPNLVTEQAGITGHSFKAGFNDINRIPPGAVDYALGQGQVFKPDVVTFNYGNCYSVSTGAFTAKIKGVYAFKFSAYTNQSYNDLSRPTLFRNNIQYQTTGARIGNNGNQVYSNIYLDVNDNVTVKSASGSLFLYSDHTHNQFCGHLIHAVI